MTGIFYSTTVSFTLKDSGSLSSVFGEYTLRAACVYNFVTLKKGQAELRLSTSQLIEFRKIIDKVIQDLETGVP